MLTEEQKQNIGRGVKAALERKRRADAMKASWVRRRANGATILEKVHAEPFKCTKCHKVFGSAPALRMHHIRKHSSKGWNTAGNFNKNHRKIVAAAAPPVTFCPVCGCNVKNVALAVSFGSKS